MEKPQYDFERLKVYQKALDFVEQVFTLTEQFPANIQYSLGDQFRRAALSTCNNIAEGSRKRGQAKKQFYGYALDSVRECVPMIELSVRRKVISKIDGDKLGEDCFHLSNMLYRLILSVV